MEKMLSIKETAEHLNVSTKTIYNLVERGEIKASKVGNVWRIHPKDIKDYLDRKEGLK